jgi:hypothetical protein
MRARARLGFSHRSAQFHRARGSGNMPAPCKRARMAALAANVVVFASLLFSSSGLPQPAFGEGHEGGGHRQQQQHRFSPPVDEDDTVILSG